jgi:hypothetical protein
MPRLRLAALAAALLLVALSAAAADNVTAPPGSEQLLVAPYPDTAPWKKITDHRDDKMLWYEWIPSDQSTDNIRDILTEQEFFPLKGRDVSDFVRSIIARAAGSCRDSKHNGPVVHTELGYQIAYAQIYCVGAGDKDVDIFLKAISGNDALYIVQREFRRPAEPGAMPGMRRFGKDQLADVKAVMAAQKIALDYLDGVKLCPHGTAAPECTPMEPSSTAMPASAPVSSTASSPAPANTPNASDSLQINGWPVPGKTTADEVREKLGRPLMENHSDPFHRGEYTMVFQPKDGLFLTFLFDKNDLVVRMRAYKQNGSP